MAVMSLPGNRVKEMLLEMAANGGQFVGHKSCASRRPGAMDLVMAWTA